MRSEQSVALSLDSFCEIQGLQNEVLCVYAEEGHLKILIFLTIAYF